MARRVTPSQFNSMLRRAGSASEIVQAILIQSDELLQDSFLREIDLNAARMRAIDATGELLAMGRIRDRVKSAEEEQIEALVGKRLEHGSIIPFLHDAVQDTKNFLSRSDHFMKEVHAISKIFLGRFGNYEQAFEKEKKAGLSKEEQSIFKNVIRYIRFIREARNASEHPHEKKRIVVTNFRLLHSGEVATPTFEFLHPKYGQPQIDLPHFMDSTVESPMNLYGAWLALLCARKAIHRPFDVGVMLLPKDERKYPRSGFCYALPTTNGWQPLG